MSERECVGIGCGRERQDLVAEAHAKDRNLRLQPARSVQFHPEARPGPVDTDFLFDEFVSML